jgi:hypothetical protein
MKRYMKSKIRRLKFKYVAMYRCSLISLDYFVFSLLIFLNVIS